MSETAESKDYLIVDMGCGESPFPMRPESRAIAADQEYRGYDLFPRTNPQAVNRRLQSAWRHEGAGRVERADCTDLPLDRGRAKESILINVLSDRRVRDRETILGEAVRILRRPCGLLTIVDTYDADGYPLRRAREALGRLGLRQINCGREWERQAIRQYSDPHNKGEHYIGVFTFHGNDVSNTRPNDLHLGSGYSSIVRIKTNGGYMATDREVYRGAVGTIRQETDKAKPVAQRGKETLGDHKKQLKGFLSLLDSFGGHIKSARTDHDQMAGILTKINEELKDQVLTANKKLGGHHETSVNTFNKTIGQSGHPIIEEHVRPGFNAWQASHGDTFRGLSILATLYGGLINQSNERDEALTGLTDAISKYGENVITPVNQGIDGTAGGFENQVGAVTKIDSGLALYQADALR
jgi:hypothetical protein